MLNVDSVYSSSWTTVSRVADFIRSLKNKKPDVSVDEVLASLDEGVSPVEGTSAPFADFQTANGVIIPDTPTCVDIAAEAYKQAVGLDLDTTPDTHIGRMIEQSGRILKSALALAASNVMQHDIDNASGMYLDSLASLFYCERRAARATTIRINVQLYKAELGSYKLTRDTCRFKDGNGVVFYPEEEYELTEQDREKTVVFICEKVGEITPNPIGWAWTYDRSIISVSGVDATNIETFEYNLGYDLESDSEFRARIKKMRHTSVGYLESIKSELAGIDGVYESFVVENCTGDIAEISGVPGVIPHSMIVFLRYDGLRKTEEALAEAVLRSKPCGCAYTTNENSLEFGQLGCEQVSVVIKDEWFGQEHKVIFTKPKEMVFGITIDVSRGDYTGGDIGKAVYDAIVSWYRKGVKRVPKPTIAHDIKTYEIGSAINDILRGVQINDMKLLFDIEDVKHEDTVYAIPAYGLGVLDMNNITIYEEENLVFTTNPNLVD